MSRQASPAVIGGFVVGALVLVVLGILVFGSGRFFADTDRVVMYFADDLQGLQAGAAVDFQGVPVGTVAQIKAVISKDSEEAVPQSTEPSVKTTSPVSQIGLRP